MTNVIKRGAPPRPFGFQYRFDLSRAATSRELKTAPRHRWFYFPHSYSPRLIYEVLEYWNFPESGILVDHFVGSGTTLLAARQKGLCAYGFDLSPLSVVVANTKTASYSNSEINKALQYILNTPAGFENPKTARLSKAFTEEELKEIVDILGPIRRLDKRMRCFFLVALLWTARGFSRAVPDGGWFRWREWSNRSREILGAFEDTVGRMAADVEALNWDNNNPDVTASVADARNVPLQDGTVDGVITSPPYANRHDYTRVFHIELLLLGLTEPKVTKLRHESIRSNVEARFPNGFDSNLAGYRIPEGLKAVLEDLPPDADPRIEPLLNGYFEDIFLSLLQARRILKCGGRVAYVLGNVRHAGVMVPVDEITTELSSQAGLSFDSAWVMRLRGNSAQQMGQYGREPARETIVLMSKDI